MTYVFTTSLSADRFMADLQARGVKFTYWHVSVANHRVTIIEGPTMR